MSTNSSTTEALTAGRLPPPAITSEGKRESSRQEKGLGKAETSGESKSLRAEGREEGEGDVGAGQAVFIEGNIGERHSLA